MRVRNRNDEETDIFEKFMHRQISAAAKSVSPYNQSVFPERPRHPTDSSSREASSDGRLALFEFLMENVMGVRYVDCIEKQLKTAGKLLIQFHDLMTITYTGNRKETLKRLHQAAERCAYELFQCGFPTPTMLRLLVSEGNISKLCCAITSITDTWEHLATMGAHNIISEIKSHQEKVIREGGPWAKCLLADGYGGRYCVLGHDAESFLNGVLKSEWNQYMHRRTTIEDTVELGTVVLPPIPFTNLCTPANGHDWLPTVKDLRLLASLAPVAPQHRWMLQNSSWENIIHRQMLPGTTTDDIFLRDTDTEVEVTCQLALYHSRRIEEQIECLLRSARNESELSTSVPATSVQATSIPTTSTQRDTLDIRRESSVESIMSSDDSVEMPEQRPMNLASVNGGGVQ